MDILINGERVELPKIGESYIDIRIYETGEIVIDGDQDKTAKAVALPEHGRLGDLDELSDKLTGKGITRLLLSKKSYITVGDVKTIIDNAPIIVEASE